MKRIRSLCTKSQLEKNANKFLTNGPARNWPNKFKLKKDIKDSSFHSNLGRDTKNLEHFFKF